jgi:hypothetical protein
LSQVISQAAGEVHSDLVTEEKHVTIRAGEASLPQQMILPTIEDASVIGEITSGALRAVFGKHDPPDVVLFEVLVR